MHAHRFVSSHHEQYERCVTCGTFHSKVPFPKENYLDNYWDESKGHSTLADQRHNCEVFVNEKGESKVQAVLKYCVDDSILEVACAPGSLLYAGKQAGFFCRGIEPDHNYCAEISDYSGCDVACGFFENFKDSKKYSNIVAMDLLEHLDDPEGFVEKAMGLLEIQGRLILMLPTAETARPQDFHPEHINLFSRRYIEEWLKPKVIEEWIPGHTILVITKIGFMGGCAVCPDKDGRLMVEI